jgi:hypothetical protein
MVRLEASLNGLHGIMDGDVDEGKVDVSNGARTAHPNHWHGNLVPVSDSIGAGRSRPS